MIKDLPDALRMALEAIIEQGVKDACNKDELSFIERVNYAFDYVITNSVFIAKDKDTEDEIKEKIIGMVEVTIEKPKVIDDNYEPWLEDAKTDISWNHKYNYYKYLITKKGWASSTVMGSIDKTTDIILDHMGNPRTGHHFNKKGLVIGDIQSGKTANYTGLINKSIDVGYKMIIILAGQQNDLRSQTQERLDKEVLGYETSKADSMKTGTKIGLGTLDFFTADVECLTSRGNTGDFKKKPGVPLYGPGKLPVIAVVKKNTTVLRNLYEDLNREINLVNGKLDIPILIIDDEVDQASVNTKKDPETEPTAINRHIRNIIALCNKVSYVGYTATPYANVLINSDVKHELYLEDLFPKDFIVLLPTPAGYCGVNDFFGTEEDDSTYDLVNFIDDYGELVDFEFDDDVFKLKAQNEITNLSGSLKDAIDDYLVASAIRRSRGDVSHNGMMVHLAAFKKPATSLKDLLEEYVNDLKIEYKFDHEPLICRLENVFYNRFVPVSQKRGKIDSWDKVKLELDDVFELLKVKLLNGDSKDIIDYTTSSQSQIIAVGGNKLSRGITIEGLMISYYLRDSRAYDTTLQMGRWFGHKEKYIDLCRIYTEQSLIDNFVHIMDATEKLRTEISEMNDKNLTPKEFGLKIMTHPTMLPTARNKMYGAQKLVVNYSGARQETTSFNIAHKDDNFNITDSFIKELIDNNGINRSIYDSNVNVFRNVPYYTVRNFFNTFHDSSDRKIDSWKNYIDTLTEDNEITNWTVIVASNLKPETEPVEIGGILINKGRRTSSNNEGSSCRVIATPRDFKYYFDDPKLQDAYKNGYNKEDIELQKKFTKENAILVIYTLDLNKSKDKSTIIQENVIGLATWYPVTNNEKAKADYYVNTVYMTQKEIEEANDGEE